jgi:sugar lactone lactonase YvrE
MLAACGEDPFSTTEMSDAATDNPVVRENRKAGDAGWKLQRPTYHDDLSGYLSTDSAEAGNVVKAFVHSRFASSARYVIHRVGWYGGAGGRKIAEGQTQLSAQQGCPVDSKTGKVECQWSSPFSFTVGADWLSGVYLVTVTRADGPDCQMIFTVRDYRRADVMAQQSVTTWQAYNNYRGESLYEDRLKLPFGHAVQVSFNRPYAPHGTGQFFLYEAHFVRWLESQGYDVTYVTNLDFARQTALPLRVKVFLSIGHDEYWSGAQRSALEGARSAGVSQGYFSANTSFWRIRVGPGLHGNHRTITCYKDGSTDPLGHTLDSTARWRDAPVSQPENGLLGVMYEDWDIVNVPLAVTESGHWLFQNTGMKDGDSIGLLVGYESDHTWNNGATPSGTQVLASHPLADVFGRPSVHEMAVHTHPSGAHVLGTGTIEWGWGLMAPGIADARVQQMTHNFLKKTGANPGTAHTAGPVQNVWTRAAYASGVRQVSTLAGVPNWRGTNDGMNFLATFNRPHGVAVGSDGRVFVADAASDRIRLIRNNSVSTLAGSLRGNDDGSGKNARFFQPTGIAAGPGGILYVADTGNHCIRRVSASGQVTTFAGRCSSEEEGKEDGPVRDASFSYPQGVAAASDGTVYVADTGNNAIRRIRGGQVTTLAKSPGGQPDASVFHFPNAITLKPGGGLYVVNGGQRSIKEVSLSGAVSTVLAPTYANNPFQLPDSAGGGFADGPLARAQAMPSFGIAATARALYFSDAGNNRVRRIDLQSRQVTTLAGSGRAECKNGSASSAGLMFPQGLAISGSNLYVADSCGTIRRIELSGSP